MWSLAYALSLMAVPTAKTDVVLLAAGVEPAEMRALVERLHAAGVNADAKSVTLSSEAEAAQRGKWVEQGLALCRLAKERAYQLDDSALVKFEEGLALLGRGASSRQDFMALATCFIDQGTALSMQSGRIALANRSFSRALAVAPELVLDKVHYSPPVLKQWAAMQAEVARAGRGTLTVVGTPEGAGVFLDGSPIGSLPMSLTDVVPGAHWLRVESRLKRTFSAELVIKAGEISRVEAFLVDAPAASIETRAFSSWQSTGPNGALLELAGGRPLVLLDNTGASPAWRGLRDGRLGERRTAASLQRVGDDIAAWLKPAAPSSEPMPPVAIELAVPRLHPALALLPFGVAQFLEKRPLVGSLLLVTQVGLLATNIVCFWVSQRERAADGSYANAFRGEAFKWVVDVSLVLLVGDVIFGAVDGMLHR